MPTRLDELFARATMTLGISQRAMGELLGVSTRTVSRWVARGCSFMPAQLETLAREVYPRDPALAGQLAREAGQTLEGLGIVAAPPPPAPPPPPPPPVRALPPIPLLVDSVVCASAQAAQSMPDGVRGTVAAAFRRARAMGLSVEEVDDVLTPGAAEEGTAKGGGAKKKAR